MKGVSVIVCCYNSALRLNETLKHLALQKTDSLAWEVVLVDNASTDNTKEVAFAWWQELSRSDVKLLVVDQPIQGLSMAREKGIQASSYDVIIFCDDDNWLEQNYVRSAYEILESNRTIGALGGTGTAVTGGAFPWWFEKYQGCYACYPQGQRDGELKDTYSFLYGAGLSIKREALQKLAARKFTPILPDRVGTALTSGGDTELSYAIRLVGYKLWFSEKLKFSHCLPASRLTEEYLYKLLSTMSYCSGLLIIYNYVLSEKKMNQYVWLKDILFQMYFFGKSLLGYPFTNSPPLARKLDLAFSYNRMLSIFHQVGTYRRRYSQVWHLKDMS